MKTMNDLTTLAYDLGDLIDSMPEFDADFIYHTWDAVFANDLMSQMTKIVEENNDN